METAQEGFATVVGRYADPDSPPPEIPRVSFALALKSGDDPLHILPYPAGLGILVRRLDDILQVNADDTEEEVRGFRVAEGVLVTVASDGLWLLFEP